MAKPLIGPPKFRPIAEGRANGIGIFAAFCNGLPGIFAARIVHRNQGGSERQRLPAGQYDVPKAQAQLGFVLKSGQGLFIFRFSYFALNPCARRNNHGAIIGPHRITHGRGKAITGF